MTLLLAVLLAGSASPDLDARRKQLKDLIDEQWEYNLKDSPEFASVIGDKRYNDKLSDRSEKHVFENIERDKVMLARFSAIDTTGFPEQEALNKSLIVRDLQLDVESVRFKDWEQPVSQFSGIHINAPQLVTVLSFETVKDYEDYIARLKALPQAFDQTTALMRRGIQDALMPPKILLEQVAKQSGSLAETKPEESPFMEPAKKIPASFSDQDKARLHE